MSLYERMTSEIVPALKSELGLKNPLAAPRIEKVKVNVGIGTLIKTTKDYSEVIENIAKICGQRPVVTKSKKAISNFKIREGLAIGITATLRRKRAYDMVDRIVSVILPRVRDFRGLSVKSFDGNGNFSVGFKEALVFPEISPDSIPHGVQVTIVTTAKNDKEGEALLRKIGFPFKKEA